MKYLSLGVVVGILLLFGGAAYAVQSTSSHYEVNEVQFGAGGLLNATSSHYQAQESVGSTGVGSTSSPDYWIKNGYLTPNAPFLEMVVNTASLNLGTLSSASTATGTATFHVRAYVDSGYTVLTMSNPPVQEDGAFINALASPTASSTGTEQFGMNLVQNLTSCATPAPANFGANPNPVPTSAFATGQAATGYNTCGLFKYHKGDTVAQSSGNGWGETDYTISYMVNINPISKAGSYSMSEDLVAVATF